MSGRWLVVCMFIGGCAEDDYITSTPPAGGAGDTGAPGGNPGGVGYSDVAPILAAHCLGCHSDPPRNGAPISLATYEAASVKADRIVARAVDADPSPMPPGGTVLSDLEASMLVAWAEAGAPR